MRRPHLRPTRQLLTERVMIREPRKVDLRTWGENPLRTIVLEEPVHKLVRRHRRDRRRTR